MTTYSLDYPLYKYMCLGVAIALFLSACIVSLLFGYELFFVMEKPIAIMIFAAYSLGSIGSIFGISFSFYYKSMGDEKAVKSVDRWVNRFFAPVMFIAFIVAMYADVVSKSY